MSAEVHPPWFMLYGGQSADGRGEGKYVGRTTNKNAAQKHAEMEASNPYSIGFVLIVTDNKVERASAATDWQAI